MQKKHDLRFIVSEQDFPCSWFRNSAASAPDGAWTVYRENIYDRLYNTIEQQWHWVPIKLLSPNMTEHQQNEIRRVWDNRISNLTAGQFQQLAWGFPGGQHFVYDNAVYRSTGCLNLNKKEMPDGLGPKGNWLCLGKYCLTD